MGFSRESALEKLRRGQSLLASGSNEDAVLGTALVALHGALEDRLRELLMARLPAQRDQIKDSRVFQWKDILALAQYQLGLPKRDSDFILQANEYRSIFAHSGRFQWNWEGLKQYEEIIIQLWSNGSRTPVYVRPGSRAAVPYSPPRYPAQPARKSNALVTEFRGLPGIEIEDRPWYRSTAFYWVLFVLLMPVWGIWIQTDTQVNRWRKDGAFALALAALMIGAGLLNLFQVLPLPALAMPDLALPALTSSGTQEPTAGLKPTAVMLVKAATRAAEPATDTAQTPSLSIPVTSGTPTGCEITWKEYKGSSLKNKNRAMVWSEVVSKRVSGSDLKVDQFLAQVIEKNPTLKADGYVFKDGQAYLLPECR